MDLDFNAVIGFARQGGKKKVVISGQKDLAALASLSEAKREGWVEPLAIGRSFADMDGEMEIAFSSVDVDEARLRALNLIQSGKAEILMDTGPLEKRFFSLLFDQIKGIGGGEIISYVSLLIPPGTGRLTLFTDTLIHRSPRLKDKVGIVENVIKFAGRLGIERPKVAALAPLELVNPALESTLDAAILSKMSERGQFGQAIVEGPLAMDNAASASAARHKGIMSVVPGNVDIYLFPDLESAHLTAQFLAWVGRLQFGGILLGTPFPIAIRSPLERPDSWLINLALACSSKG
ncbi:MAG: phosphate acyltransferase [Thermodesulfobacteriota bacterium]|nr:phosphate acyltransferase [Thermodesulfobacteriota bacterium]